ncbi:MAG: PAS domain-containing sensor histidine kinase [Campylobacterota bacterium]
MNNLSSLTKTLLAALVIVAIVVTIIISSLSILKEDIINTQKQIAKLHANTLSNQVTQTFNNINLLSSNLISVLNEESDFENINRQFKEVLFNNPYIRSVNILNTNEEVIYSSNKQNIGLHFSINDFYPKPLFDKSILRFGIPWVGRDLIDGYNITHVNDISKDAITFIPVIKQFQKSSGNYHLLININSEYFVNRFANELKNTFAYIDLYRLDDFLLFSSDESYTPGSLTSKSKLYEKAKDAYHSFGIEKHNNRQYVSSYNLAEIFPLNIAVRIDLQKSLKQWEKKTSKISLLIISLVIISSILVLALLFKYFIEKEKELKLQRKQLKQQKKFQVLFEQTIFLAAVMDKFGNLAEVNNKGFKYLKESSKEVINMKFWNLSCWDEEEKLYIKDKIQNFKYEKLINKELKLRDKKGNQKIIEFSLFPLEIDDEVELVALGLDVTDKKSDEEQLRQAYTVFQNTHDGIVITDKDTKIININKAFADATLYSLNEIKGKTPNILKSGAQDESFYKNMWDKIDKKGLWEGELTNKKKNGDSYDEYITISAVYDENKRIKNYIGIFSDTTAQKIQEAKLKEQEQLIHQQSKMAAMGEMLENIAHQWRQPLSVISTIATGIVFKKEMNICDEKEEIEELKKINESTQYLSETINDFRDFLKANKPKVKFDLKTTVEKTLKLVSSKFKNRSIVTVLDVDYIEIYGVENELIQVLLNIFNNSKDALENKSLETKVIIIETKKYEKNITINIKDNAGGIKENIINRVFEPYFTTKHKSQGTGIGLYMSQEIIVKHFDGTIRCFNTNFEFENNSYTGVNFEISLPI